MATGWLRALQVALLLCLALGPSVIASSPPLKRSDAKRWKNLDEAVTAEIKRSTKRFLQERGVVSAAAVCRFLLSQPA